MTDASAEVVIYAGHYMNLFLNGLSADRIEALTDKEIEAWSRVAFVAARTTIALSRGLEEAAAAGQKS